MLTVPFFGRVGFPVVTSGLVLAPCLLPARIQAGDLSSHLYNTWLTQLIRAGQAPGLWLASQRTNVLFDVMLDWLWRLFGPQAAERMAVSAAVLVFFWGAYALARALGRGEALVVAPSVAMVTYGWFFHTGFFNFYMATGFSFWLLWLLLKPSRARLLAAVPVALLGAAGNALPVAMAVGLAGYMWVAGRMKPRHRPFLLGGSMLLLLAAGLLLGALLVTKRYANQMAMITGTDQVLVFGSKYFLVQLGLLGMWIAMAAKAARLRGSARTWWDRRLHLALLCGAAAVLLPASILFPGYQHGLLFVAERMSLWTAVMLCGVLGVARLKGAERLVAVALAAVFFVFLGYDVIRLNQFEDKVERALAGLPAGARVVSGVTGATAALNPLVHMVDRACIGRCFSFANYEPSTAAFRVRCRPGNPVVAASYAECYALQSGGYVVKAADPPLYSLTEEGGGLALRLLRPGEVLRVKSVALPPDFY